MGHHIVDEDGARDGLDRARHPRHVQALDTHGHQLGIAETLDRGTRELPNDANRSVGRWSETQVDASDCGRGAHDIGRRARVASVVEQQPHAGVVAPQARDHRREQRADGAGRIRELGFGSSRHFLAPPPLPSLRVPTSSDADTTPTIRYSVEGAIATITLNRPDAANAQNSRMIDELDAAFDHAEADDAVRVVVLAAAGKHFSAGHDLKELLAGEEHWSAMRATPEGKLRHEQVMYFDKLVRIRDLRKPTIAAVQGTCSAAGLMLACMCDLIVAADDARFSNPVLRMSGVGVELLVEPWELGPRKAKEFLFCAQEFGAVEAERYGLVNRVVPRAELQKVAQELAEQVALVPPLTAEAVKASINHMVDLMGQRESWRYHFMLHQFVSNTPTALAKVEARKAGGMKAVKKEQGRS